MSAYVCVCVCVSVCVCVCVCDMYKNIYIYTCVCLCVLSRSNKFRRIQYHSRNYRKCDNKLAIVAAYRSLWAANDDASAMIKMLEKIKEKN